MRSGGGKQKGASFEREVCVKLSLWVTAGKRKDCLWRSAMSGGRATVAYKKGDALKAACGDICATAPEGHILTDRWYIETKHVRDLQLWGLFTEQGKLHKYWLETNAGASKFGKEPMLIAKQNNAPVLVVTPWVNYFKKSVERVTVQKWGAYIYLFDELLKEKYVP